MTASVAAVLVRAFMASARSHADLRHAELGDRWTRVGTDEWFGIICPCSRIVELEEAA